MSRFYLLLSFFFMCSVATTKGQINRALVVTIGQYPAKSGWNEIHAVNDVDIVLPMLLRNGYKKENIKTIVNEKATKASIVKALNNIYKQSKRGDCVYVHFSCHGQQMMDDNGDEPDGLDEALIPYDAMRRYHKGVYEGENHLRDDELGELLDQIRSKLGTSGNLTVVLDACHSATGTRDDDDVYVRGTSYIFGSEVYAFKEIDSKKLNLCLRSGDGLAPVVVFSACQTDERNYEYRNRENNTYYGSLTFSFCKLMKQHGQEKITNAQFYEKLRSEFELMPRPSKRKQTPYFESTDDENPICIGK